MSVYVLLIPILLPILGGATLGICRVQNRKLREVITMAMVLLTSACVAVVLVTRPEGSATVLTLAGSLAVKFRLDGMSCVFAALVAVLWPLATLYAFEYMEHEGNTNTFFTWYTMTYGVTLGIAFAGNLMTMYMFYEMLTLVTIPLMMHGRSYKAMLATRKYVRYSIGGAAFAFIGFIAIAVYGETLDFRMGGVLTEGSGSRTMLLIVYGMTVLGFGVKSAIFPFHGWLPTASVAPTPVTALLHAVAVVKAGAFAIMRVTYYSFGKNFLRGTWVQYTVMMFAVVTMVYGAVKAVKEQDCKRRLAYSTVSNLSYIIFAASLMRSSGMQAAMLHMLFHGLMKITLFYCIGAVMVKAGKRYVWEMDGMGRKMPLIFAVYTVAGISLIGIPPLAGFASKWYIGTAAVLADTGFGYVGLGALILSALLSAAYILEVVVRAWLPRKDTAGGEHSEGSSASETVPAAGTPEEPAKVGLRMAIPLVVLMILIILCGVASTPVAEFLADVAYDVF